MWFELRRVTNVQKSLNEPPKRKKLCFGIEVGGVESDSERVGWGTPEITGGLLLSGG